MPRNRSEVFPQELETRQVRHDYNPLQVHPLTLTRVSAVLWRITITAPMLEYVTPRSRWFTSGDDAAEVFRAFPSPFTYGCDVGPTDEWREDTDYQADAT